jgi:hypothetical protein
MAFSVLTSSRQWAITSLVLAAGAVVLYRFDPTMAHFYPPCVFHALTGLQCPGCGSTRALHHLLHGDVSGAFRLNPLLFAMAPFMGIASRWPRILTKPSVAWTIAAVVVTYGIVRNLPFWPYPL